MRYFENVDKNLFYKKPVEINKYTNKELLQYGLGANLYMNALKDIFYKLISGGFENIGVVTICFEDAIKENDVEKGEKNVLELLNKLSSYKEKDMLKEENMPIIFIRVRNINQFINFTEKLNRNQIRFIGGFTFPKFDTSNAEIYLEHLSYLNHKFDTKLYAMPIFESKDILYKESRIKELLTIKGIIKEYKNLILNIRVGGTDFSSKFGLRRSVKYSIYDIRVISECLIDIINIFSRREDEYTISAPVWEYFSSDLESEEVQGLIKEINYDKENGFYGKTIIHPYQGKYVNAAYAVSYEDYIDSKNIIESSQDGGVFKGFGDNKMNEVLPHLNWARKNIIKAEVFGVLNEGVTMDKLYE